MTVKELRKAISNLPDDGEVFVQRIEDKYFENHGWTVKLIEGESYHRYVGWNKAIDLGIYFNNENYPNIKPGMLLRVTDEELEASKEQYIDTHCCINYDGKNLYITSHY